MASLKEITNQEAQTGWVLKKPSKHARFSAKHKSYLLQKFNVGEESGRKCDVLDVKMDMRKAKNDIGQKLFTQCQQVLTGPS